MRVAPTRQTQMDLQNPLSDMLDPMKSSFSDLSANSNCIKKIKINRWFQIHRCQITGPLQWLAKYSRVLGKSLQWTCVTKCCMQYPKYCCAVNLWVRIKFMPASYYLDLGVLHNECFYLTVFPMCITLFFKNPCALVTSRWNVWVIAYGYKHVVSSWAAVMENKQIPVYNLELSPRYFCTCV